jgi:hypothetical protein
VVVVLVCVDVSGTVVVVDVVFGVGRHP